MVKNIAKAYEEKLGNLEFMNKLKNVSKTCEANIMAKEDKKKLDEMEFMNPPEVEEVTHPDHYNQGKYEAWDVIDDWCGNLNSIEGYYVGNALKYLCRWKYKGGVNDLKKAENYISRLVEILEEN